MAGDAPTLYFDLGSPYAYLALERAPAVLGLAPRLEPVLLGAIFARRGFGSWAATPARETRTGEIERRAERYGLPPLRWPQGWPAEGLQAMRAAVWAQREGAAGEFARAAFRAQFVEGADIADAGVLRACAAASGLEPGALETAVASDDVKLALRAKTEAAWDAGVRGVPSVAIGETIFFGDDQLELAAATLVR
jgi:2-hydroxychromene-2-carboxylate isomerase